VRTRSQQASIIGQICHVYLTVNSFCEESIRYNKYSLASVGVQTPQDVGPGKCTAHLSLVRFSNWRTSYANPSEAERPVSCSIVEAEMDWLMPYKTLTTQIRYEIRHKRSVLQLRQSDISRVWMSSNLEDMRCQTRPACLRHAACAAPKVLLSYTLRFMLPRAGFYSIVSHHVVSTYPALVLTYLAAQRLRVTCNLSGYWLVSICLLPTRFSMHATVLIEQVPVFQHQGGPAVIHVL
jgi:hypothetical protein